MVPEDPPSLRPESGPGTRQPPAATPHLWDTRAAQGAPEKGPPSTGSPSPEGRTQPIPQASEPRVGKGDVLPSHSRLNCAERAGVPLSECLTCRLRPPGPGRRRPGRRGRRGRGRGGGGAQPLRCSAGKMAAGREGGSAGGRGGPEAAPPPPSPAALRRPGGRHLPPLPCRAPQDRDRDRVLGSQNLRILESPVLEETFRMIQSDRQRSSTTETHHPPPRCGCLFQHLQGW